jgi:ribA/ribD-fused uncharacterized protein
MNKIVEFQGKYRFLSNFWPVENTTVEHQYQAAKFTERAYYSIVLKAKSPGEAKRLGRQYPIRPDWNQVKVGIMLNLLRWKFSHPDLKEQLLATGDAILEEGNNWNDRFWGICPPGSGNGQNVLGELLMQVRSEYRK